MARGLERRKYLEQIKGYEILKTTVFELSLIHIFFVGMPSAPDGKGGYRETAKPITKEFREELNTAVLEAYEAKLEQMVERGSAGRGSISDQLKAGKEAAEQAKAEKPQKAKASRNAER